MGAESCIQVFARAPVPGATKTRLISLLGAEGAAALHRRLVRRALSTAIAARIGPVQLWCTPSIDDAFFSSCASLYDIDLHKQSQGDLGARMEDALRHGLMGYKHTLLIGCDCPALKTDDLLQAVGSLRDGVDAVLTPAEDGGYTLLGLSRIDHSLFHDIAWGSDQVMTMTRDRLRALGWRSHELRTLWDIDRPEDVERMQRENLLDTPLWQT